MTNHAVLIPSKVAAKDVDAYVRPAISASALDNGNVFTLPQKTGVAGEGEVWLAKSLPVSNTASTSGCAVWMAGEPELPFATAGDNVYRGLGNIQDFYISACTVFTAFKPQVGDIITLTSDALDSSTTAAYAIASDTGNYKLKWSATVETGFTLRYLKTSYIPNASGSAIGTGRITAYQFEVMMI